MCSSNFIETTLEYISDFLTNTQQALIGIFYRIYKIHRIILTLLANKIIGHNKRSKCLLISNNLGHI